MQSAGKRFRRAAGMRGVGAPEGMSGIRAGGRAAARLLSGPSACRAIRPLIRPLLCSPSCPPARLLSGPFICRASRPLIRPLVCLAVQPFIRLLRFVSKRSGSGAHARSSDGRGVRQVFLIPLRIAYSEITRINGVNEWAV